MDEFAFEPVVEGRRLANIRLSLTLSETTATWSAYDLTADNPRGSFLAAQRYTHDGCPDVPAAMRALLTLAADVLQERMAR